MVMTTWGRVISRFDFSIVDYTVITGSHASNQGSTGAQKTNEFQISNWKSLLTSTSWYQREMLPKIVGLGSLSTIVVYNDAVVSRDLVPAS